MCPTVSRAPSPTSKAKSSTHDRLAKGFSDDPQSEGAAHIAYVSVSPLYGRHYLDAVSEIRELYGTEVHVTGGLSNVSFGLPKLKLINDTFIHLSIEAGIDTGIVDPVQSKIEEVFTSTLTLSRHG